ncbi:MAG: TonB-dependent receptor [Mucilaginibacter sp.]|nr:TonB-dependent receptor [Mucilaginibacter sp.]
MVLATLCLFSRLPAQEISPQQTILIKGVVTDESGNALPGASVQRTGDPDLSITDKDGRFQIPIGPIKGTLIISYLGYKKLQVPYDQSSPAPLVIKLQADLNNINEIQVIGYGKTTRRLNTGNVATIDAQTIAAQPVTNVVSALSGRIAGAVVQTTNGLPGGNVSIQIRGKGSITAGTDPLYIVDGVPFPSVVVDANNILGQSAINGAVSPLNSLNPSDIESISILKDADATAIYGSRGSNGVVLITTKKGKSGKTVINLGVSEGVSRVASMPRLLNAQQYLQIRREAYHNDGTVPSADPNDDSYAPDLMEWDTKKSTDWAKYLLGRTAHFTDIQGNISGGSQLTSFIIGGNYHSENTVLTGANNYTRGGIHTTLQHSSADQKFSLQFTTTYNSDKNRLSNITSNFTGDLLLPPDFPLYDASGNYNYYLGWNPLADLSAVSKTTTRNLNINMLLKYTIAPGLDLKASGGYNRIDVQQVMTYPTNSQYQGSNNFSNFGNNSNESIIVEPQLTYNRHIGEAELTLLGGATYQRSGKTSELTQASNFSSDQLLENVGAATAFTLFNSNTDYRYVSVFGRATLNLKEKYLLNASLRRDGSSRFGPGNQFGNFGALGAGWLFGEEDFIKKALPFLSYGKLRASFGSTGNDQIPDYQYLSTYAASGYVYQQIAGLQPSRIANANFHWETTKKLEFAAELGFLHNRLLLNISHYRNRTKDQLVNYALPYISGFSSYQANLPAVIENSGWELELSSTNIKTSSFSWSTSFNLTIPKNTLLKFQGLATSSYARSLVIGEPITRLYGYRVSGLDASGLPLFDTPSGTPTTTPSSATDQYYTIGKGYPAYYGGIGNTLTYRRWTLEIFGQFTRQFTRGGFTSTPGLLTNNFAYALTRWQGQRDQTIVPRSSNDYTYSYPYSQSSAIIFNSSYFRIKNIALSRTIDAKWLGGSQQHLKIYLQAQNLYTFWNKNIPVYDPETGAGTNIPPMKTLVAGIQLTL